jgi:hypothetical protein
MQVSGLTSGSRGTDSRLGGGIGVGIGGGDAGRLNLNDEVGCQWETYFVFTVFCRTFFSF